METAVSKDSKSSASERREELIDGRKSFQTMLLLNQNLLLTRIVDMRKKRLRSTKLTAQSCMQMILACPG
jgi:hypothetical protein